MTGRGRRRKGHDFERLIANVFREAWPLATVRRGQQGDGAHEPDVVIEGYAPGPLPRLWIECQHADDPTPRAKLSQAERDIGESVTKVGLPIVVWRRTKSTSVSVTTRLWMLWAVGIVPAPTEAPLMETMVVTMELNEFVAALRERWEPGR